MFTLQCSHGRLASALLLALTIASAAAQTRAVEKNKSPTINAHEHFATTLYFGGQYGLSNQTCHIDSETRAIYEQAHERTCTRLLGNCRDAKSSVSPWKKARVIVPSMSLILESCWKPTSGETKSGLTDFASVCSPLAGGGGLECRLIRMDAFHRPR